MGKNKLAKFEEMKSFDHVYQSEFKDVLNKDFYLKGKWHKEVFKNNYPIVLELGCGKGEYTVGMAKRYPEKNFIGVDIKGARIYKGAKAALELNLQNVRFIRTRIDFISSFFAENELSEIWLTFPDPQAKKFKKRLSSSVFLNRYAKFLKKDAQIHLKTDNRLLYEYTKALAEVNKFEIITACNNVYNNNSLPEEVLNIQTFYEKQFLAENKNIHYLSFILHNILPYIEPEEFNDKFAKEYL